MVKKYMLLSFGTEEIECLAENYQNTNGLTKIQLQKKKNDKRIE